MGPVALLFLSLCASQVTMDRVAGSMGLPTAAPFNVVSVGPEFAPGFARTSVGVKLMTREAWFWAPSMTVYIVEGKERRCVHEIVHGLQVMNGIDPTLWESERQALRIERSYRWTYLPKEAQ